MDFSQFWNWKPTIKTLVEPCLIPRWWPFAMSSLGLREEKRTSPPLRAVFPGALILHEGRISWIQTPFPTGLIIQHSGRLDTNCQRGKTSQTIEVPCCCFVQFFPAWGGKGALSFCLLLQLYPRTPSHWVTTLLLPDSITPGSLSIPKCQNAPPKSS